MPFEVLGTSGYEYYHTDDLEDVISSHHARKYIDKYIFFNFLHIYLFIINGINCYDFSYVKR